jgi:YVTN family beta-propeller protein
MTKDIRRLRRFPAGAAILIAAAANTSVASPQQVAAPAEYVLTRGVDTIAIEQFQRDARQLSGVVRQTDGTRFQYGARLRDDASIGWLDVIVTTTRDSSRTHITGLFERSHAALVQRDGQSTTSRMFDRMRDGRPFYQLSVALSEQIVRAAKTPVAGASSVVAVRLGIADTIAARVTRPAKDSAIVSVGQMSVRLALDGANDVVSGVIMPQNIQISRRASRDAVTPMPMCGDAPSSPIITIDVPGTPFQALPSADGCWVFASFPSTSIGWPAGIGVFRRSGGTITLERMLPVDGNPTGMALTHDGSLLVVAAGQRIAFVDPIKLIFAQQAGVISYLDTPTAQRLGRVYANVTPDDKFAFIADENAQAISVVSLAKARASGFKPSAVVGKIPTGALPIALTMSADGAVMYATSQRAPAKLAWPVACKREGANVRDTLPVNPQGAIHIIDVARARTDPAHSIIGSVPAGCSAVRLVLSPAGDRAYVTARNSNALLVFDTGKLRSDPAHARIAQIPVGTAPVGIAVVDSGRKVIVTNSNRFAGSASDRQSLTVIDATNITRGAAAVIGSIPAGAFPREMRVTPDGTTLLLTNFGSRSIQLIDLAHLPLESLKR